MKKSLLLGVLCLLAGCTTTHISEIGDGDYTAMLSGNLRSSEAEIFSAIFDDARAYCEKQGKKLKVISRRYDPGNLQMHRPGPYLGPVNSPGGAFAAGFNSTFMYTTGSEPSGTVNFKCVDSTESRAKTIDQNRFKYAGTRDSDKSEKYVDVDSIHWGPGKKSVLFNELITFPEPQIGTDDLNRQVQYQSFVKDMEINCTKRTVTQKKNHQLRIHRRQRRASHAAFCFPEERGPD